MTSRLRWYSLGFITGVVAAIKGSNAIRSRFRQVSPTSLLRRAATLGAELRVDITRSVRGGVDAARREVLSKAPTGGATIIDIEEASTTTRGLRRREEALRRSGQL